MSGEEGAESEVSKGYERKKTKINDQKSREAQKIKLEN
jgi:hypothetical protein